MNDMAASISGFSRIKSLCATWVRRMWIDGLVRANWLNHDRIVVWSGILLALQVLFLAFLVLWHHNAFGRVEPSSTDFVSFYAAGKLALAGSPALAYDRAAHAAAEAAATQLHTPYQFFFYPPVYLFVCAALALLPYMVAFLLFQAVTLLSWMLVMREILKARGWSWCLPVLAYPAAFWNLGLGQNAFMTAALIGGVTLLYDKRPISGGLLLALMSFKPHLALLTPFALAAGGRWRAITAAGIGTAVVIGLSAIVFGTEAWQAYTNVLAGSREVYENGSVDLAGFVTPYGAAREFGASSSEAWGVQAAMAMLVIVAVCWTWWRDPGPATRSAVLVAGILLSIPLALVYDLVLLTVAMAWLVRAGREDGFRIWEKSALFFCYLVPLVGRDLGHHFHVPVFPLAPAAILVLAVARAHRPSSYRPARGLRYNIQDRAPFDRETAIVSSEARYNSPITITDSR
jgi:alpha-1,2-mannosyltransferase